MSNAMDRTAVKWHNTAEKDFPYHGQQVIIEMQDNYAIATFNSVSRTFSFNDHMSYRTISAENDNVRWTKFKL